MRKSNREKESELVEASRIQMENSKNEAFDFDTFEFKTLEDFEIYNAQVRKHNRNCVFERNKMKIKVPDASFHKQYEVKFNKFEQRENIQKVRVRNKDIDWTGQLKSGGTYVLPMPVIEFLNGLATPEFAEVKTEHGNAVHTETKQIGEIPRFSCNILREVG